MDMEMHSFVGARAASARLLRPSQLPEVVVKDAPRGPEANGCAVAGFHDAFPAAVKRIISHDGFADLVRNGGRPCTAQGLAQQPGQASGADRGFSGELDHRDHSSTV